MLIHFFGCKFKKNLCCSKQPPPRCLKPAMSTRTHGSKSSISQTHAAFVQHRQFTCCKSNVLFGKNKLCRFTKTSIGMRVFFVCAYQKMQKSSLIMINFVTKQLDHNFLLIVQSSKMQQKIF